tara:strand:- start:162 stop:386 length:225 start_codon:yes stop_codon:yes gene_type:complete
MNTPTFNTPIMERVKYLEAKSRVDDKLITELEKGLKPLSFSEYETIVDINNHNYARYEALIEGGYIKALKEQGK